jgi:hypothetical protein
MLVFQITITPLGKFIIIMEIEQQYTLSDVTMYKPVINEELIDPVSITISGSSGEFSYFQSAFLNGDQGVVRLNWTHVANTSIVESGYSPSQDFVYLTQTFDYPFNEVPRKVYLEMDCSMTLYGDFTAERLFAAAAFWLIDPSGNWEGPDFATPSDTHTEWNLSHECTNEEKQEIFGGTIEVDGVQEDSNDQITVAFGLTPSWWFFRGETGSENWRLYNGSAILDINRVAITLVRGTPVDDPQIEEPIDTYRFPHAQGMPYFEELVSSDDGYLYTAGTGIGFLTKWSLDLKPVWIRELVNSTGYSIALFNDSIYVGGVKQGGSTTDICLTKWSTTGQLEWELIIDLDEYNDVLEDLAIDEDGFIYASVRRYIVGFAQDSLLLKLSKNGDIIWNQTLSQHTTSSVSIIDKNQILVVEEWPTILKVFNSSGFILREKTGISIATYHDGNIVCVKQELVGTGLWSWTQLAVCKITTNLNEIWNYTMNIPYNLNYNEKLTAWNVEITSEESILLYLYLYNIADEYRLYKFDANGLLEWYKIVGFKENWFGYPMASASNGLVYFATRTFDGADTLVGIDAYIYGNYTPSLEPSGFVLLISFLGIGGAIIGGVLVILIRRRDNVK